MSLKEQTSRKGDRRYGYVSLGVPLEAGFSRDFELTRANHALVFLLVGLNDNYKVPIAYFLIRHLTASERANLVRTTLVLLDEYKINVHSITYDGAAVNNSMANKLGAIMDLEAPRHKCHFQHPVTKERIFIFPDPCHMLKNVRNAFGTTFVQNTEAPFEDGTGEKISWKHVVDLHEIQKKERVVLANKLTDRHIKYHENIMSVRLAAQTLSNSVGDALRCVKEAAQPGFTSIDGTANFCKQFNDIFDFLNCRYQYKVHKLRQPYCKAITEDNVAELKLCAEDKIDYIKNLKDYHGTPLINFSRKCGFQGLIICPQKIFELYHDLHEKYNLEYLLSYKLLQDMIENLFSAIRMMGGFRNNPTPYQFQTAIRRILVHHEIVYSHNANCSSDQIKVLNVSSSIRREEDNDTTTSTEDSEDPDDFVELFNFQNITVPSSFVQYVVEYISGYIVYKMKLARSSASCQECFDSISTQTGSLLADVKNRGWLCYAAPCLISLCLHLESVIRSNGDDVLRPKFSNTLLNKIEDEPLRFLNNTHFQNNVSHASVLNRYVGKLYLRIRLHHEESIRNQVDKYVRKIYSKLTLFKNQ